MGKYFKERLQFRLIFFVFNLEFAQNEAILFLKLKGFNSYFII